jgi:hypothetical protein
MNNFLLTVNFILHTSYFLKVIERLSFLLLIGDLSDSAAL